MCVRYFDTDIWFTRHRRFDAQTLSRECQRKVFFQRCDLRDTHFHLLYIFFIGARFFDETRLDRKLRHRRSDAVPDDRGGDTELGERLHDQASRLVDGAFVGAGGCVAQQDVERRQVISTRRRLERFFIFLRSIF